VQVRLQAFLEWNDLMPCAQSAYWKYDSTDTTVANVYSDLLLAADQGRVSALCLLDLTATFDTVDHELLLLHLECQFGVRDVALQWFGMILRTCPADLSRCYMVAHCRPVLLYCAHFLKDRFLGHGCLFYILPVLQMLPMSTV